MSGELGNNTTSSSARPVAVAGGHTFRSIDCGYQHTCALDDSGKAWCWGVSFSSCWKGSYI